MLPMNFIEDHANDALGMKAMKHVNHPYLQGYEKPCVS